MSQAKRNWRHRRLASLPLISKALVVAFLGLLAFGWAFSVVQQARIASRLQPFGANVTYRHGNIVGISFDPDTSSFGDTQMPLLQGLRYIEWLHLDDTKVTTSGLVHLRRLSSLDAVMIREDQISAEEEEELSAALPHLAIQRLHVVGGQKVVDGYQ